MSEFGSYDMTKFLENCEKMNLTLSTEQQQQFVRYYELLVEWNSFMNLTGITDFQEVLQKHFEDSLALVRGADLSAVTSVMDVGTGAGFPGLPLKIAFPHLKIVLLDSLGKRVKFLNHVIEELQLDNITAIHGRAEDFAKEDELVLLCGHYEGIDERVLEEIVTDYVSAGDYVLTGGELPAMMIVDAVSRLIPGVLHNDVSAEFESFQDNLLEYPQYSRPEIWHDRQVPPILLSGHHANVEKWRREQSVIRTAKWRPDLLEDAELTMKERELAEEIIENREKDLKNEE